MIRSGCSGFLLLVTLGCRDEPATPVPPGDPAREVVLAGAPMLIGAGDIAVCGTRGDELTARLVDSVLTSDSAAKVETVVFTAGDNAYPSGADGMKNYFQRCFSPSWGRSRIIDRIRPSPGNHDYDTGSGAPYFAYFGARAAIREKVLQLRPWRLARDRAQQRALLLARHSGRGPGAGRLAAP